MAPPVLEFAKRFEEHAKGMMVPATLFEEFGFNYIGPIDGHDLDSLVPTLQNIRKRALEGAGPQFLHVVTKKGQGYKLAEADPILYHGPGKFNPAEGIRPAAKPARKTYTQVFGEWLCDMAAADKRLIGITPAMREGSGMVEFEKRFPERYYDVGIAEQHAVTFAGGMACEGLKPVVAIYSTFLQRGYDQLIHDVALQNLPVVFALDRAGLVGADGATHAGAYDIAYLRCIPNMMVMTPSDENECRQLLTTAFHQDCPTAVRYPRGAGQGVATQAALTDLPVGKGVMRPQRAARARASAWRSWASAPWCTRRSARRRRSTRRSDMRFVKPLDIELVKRLAEEHDYLVTVEEGSVMGGAGSAVLEALAEAGIDIPVLVLGLPDRFIDHGDPALLLSQCGLDAAGIEHSVRERFGIGQAHVAVASRVA